MRYYLLLLIVLWGAPNVSAQLDNASGIAIPRGNANAPSPGTNTFNTPNIPNPYHIAPEKKYKSNFSIGEDTNKSSVVIEKNEFVNRGTEYEDKFEVKQKGESNEPFRGNQFFGEYKSSSKFVHILARDFEYPDGDRIKVLVNDRIVVADIVLTNDFKGIEITLEKGFNKIDFEALNQGSSGPNTAEFTVYDDQEKVVSSNQWNLATGFKATVIIVKE